METLRKRRLSAATAEYTSQTIKKKKKKHSPPIRKPFVEPGVVCSQHERVGKWRTIVGQTLLGNLKLEAMQAKAKR